MNHIQPCQNFKYDYRENQRAQSNQTNLIINIHYILINYSKQTFITLAIYEEKIVKK